MPEIKIRKRLVILEDIFHEGGPAAATPRKRGAIGTGGSIHWQKVAELLIADFRSGVLGRITLETPEQFLQWLAAGQQADAGEFGAL
ncbi:MAG: hypothetical protein B7X99_12525, partial [Rhizobiales bacterium 17-65-6]